MNVFLIVMTILAGIATVAWAIVLYYANAMSDDPTLGFQYGWTILIPLVFTGFLGFCWWHG